MPYKGKLPNEEKIRLVEEYLSGNIRSTEAKVIAGIDGKTWRRWKI
jgi:transposase-like protein